MTAPITETVIVTVYEPGVCVNISNVELNLRTSGDIYPGVQVTWQAILAPQGASVPYSYTIDYGDGVTLTETSDSNPLVLHHTYTDPATYTVTLSAWNCGMTDPVSDTGQVVIHTPSNIYLPLVVRNR